jgi:hypothetical protein
MDQERKTSMLRISVRKELGPVSDVFGEENNIENREVI